MARGLLWNSGTVNKTPLALIFSLLVGLPVRAAVLFEEDYEVAGTDINALTAHGWTSIYCAGGSITSGPCPYLDIEHSITHGGSGSLRYIYVGPDCANGVCTNDFRHSHIGRFITPVREVYAAYWLRFEPHPNGSVPLQFVDGNGNSSFKMHYFNPAGADPLSTVYGFFYHNTSANSPSWGLQNPTDGYATVTLDPNKTITNLVHGRWYCMQYHQRINDMGQANGIWEVSVDGVQSEQHLDVDFSAQNTEAFRYVIMYRQGSAMAMYRYEDDYVLSTTPVGCSGAADTLAPAGPTALTAS
jgi:hypothetical protein